MATTIERPKVATPAHVAEGLVFDFDMFNDAGYRIDPHDRLIEILRDAPDVFWTPRNGGHWCVFRHAANFQASRDTEAFSSEFMSQEQIKTMLAMLPEGTPYIPQPAPINIDPPLHGQYRSPLQAAFSPKTMLALKDKIRALADSLIDKVIGEGRCDAIPAITEPLPVQIFLEMMGLPLERSDEFRRLVRQYLEIDYNDPMARVSNAIAVNQAMVDIIVARQTDPRDDLISMLWQSQVDGRAVTLVDMQNYCSLLFIAGLDTVINGMGYGLRHLARDQDLQDQLRANPKLIPEAAEELLRRYTFTIPARRVNRDTELAGARMAKDDVVMLFLPAANLDEREFPEPKVFDLKRENKVHIAFNSGPHRCLGSHLARIELQILYEQMLARLPSFRLDPEGSATFHGGNIIGIDSLPLVWEVPA